MVVPVSTAPVLSVQSSCVQISDINVCCKPSWRAAGRVVSIECEAHRVRYTA
jgi:hypothetical protein